MCSVQSESDPSELVPWSATTYPDPDALVVSTDVDPSTGSTRVMVNDAPVSVDRSSVIARDVGM